MPEPQTQRTLYLVANSHLDTQWRWTVRDTIRDYLPRTLREAFAAFERYPSFHLNFEGAFRYMLIREYYPEEFDRLREWVGSGRWFPAGAMLDMADVNVVSPESLIRHILYAQRFFRRELGRPCRDLMLPDCFGFNQALPSVAAHCGLLGFSGQKFISWGAPATYPFDIGLWEGPDGAAIVAAIHPEGYGAGLEADIERAPRWIERIDAMRRHTGLGIGYKYFGVRGDRGGVPDSEALENLERAVAADGPIRIVPAASDQLYRELSEAQRARLPRHAGDLLLPTHGTGCLTAQATMKRWNRANEHLADAAERAAVIAAWLGGSRYPRSRLRAAWIRFLWHQMHDDITGTSLPAAYRISWNDEVVALNQFADVLTDSVGTVAQALDTDVDGVPIVLFNPISRDREDVVTATVGYGDLTPPAGIRVIGPDGVEVPSQIGRRWDDRLEVAFSARVPSVGFAVFDVQPETHDGSDSARRKDDAGHLTVTRSSLENRYLRAEIDTQGDLCRLFDKTANRELLAAPTGLQLLRDRSARWPAWEILYDDLTAPPATVVGRPVERRIVEHGPARVTLEIIRRVGRSRFVQRLSLAAGDGGRRLEVAHDIDWRSRGRLLKAAFPLAVANPEATYDLGLGTIRRGNRRRDSYEVPAQEWVDVSAEDGSYGVSVLSDCRYGWDKPDDSTLRLTLLHSPRTYRRFRHQATQDLGRHHLAWALYGHCGDWSTADTVDQAARFNRPLMAFQTARHGGRLGRSWSFLAFDSPAVTVRALKRSEDDDRIVLRVEETRGLATGTVHLRLAATVQAVDRLRGDEQPVPSSTADRSPPMAVPETAIACLESGSLSLALGPYELRTLALTPDPPPQPLAPPASHPVALPFDRAVTSVTGEAGVTGETGAAGFDRAGHCLPAELLAPEIDSGGVRFTLGPPATGALNAVSCRGQTLDIPDTGDSHLYLLAAATDRDTSASFQLGQTVTQLLVQHYSGHIGQWRGRRRPLAGGTRPGFIKRDPVAWLGTHRHDRRGRDEPYVFCYLFRYRLMLPKGCRHLQLPDNPGILIVALTLATCPQAATTPAQWLYD